MEHDMNKAVSDKMEEVKAALVGRGFIVKMESPGILTLVHPNFSRATYLGTVLNSFSCLADDEEPGKVYMWYDVEGREEAVVRIMPVYRSNGTKQNVNLSICVDHLHWELADYVSRPDRHDLANPIYVRELRKSPTDLFGGIRKSVDYHGTREYKRKLNCDASARVTEKVVNAIVEAVEKFAAIDHSDVERDPKDFHECTRDAYFAWQKDWNERHK